MFLYTYESKNQNLKDEIKEGYKTLSSFSEKMVFEALKDYNNRNRIFKKEETGGITIKRTEKGKPYFLFEKENNIKNLNIHFSVSHSGNWWGCLMANGQVGFDLEKNKKNIDFLAIAKRFFSKEEQKFVEKYGQSAFYEIWVIKEAYIKYLGTGISEVLQSFSVVDENVILSKINMKTENKIKDKNKSCYISGFLLDNDINAAYCSDCQMEVEEIIKLR